jgi:hypothetical protein
MIRVRTLKAESTFLPSHCRLSFGEERKFCCLTYVRLESNVIRPTKECHMLLTKRLRIPNIAIEDFQA